jgi:hypothetical protein
MGMRRTALEQDLKTSQTKLILQRRAWCAIFFRELSVLALLVIVACKGTDEF